MSGDHKERWVRVGKIVMLDALIRRAHDHEFLLELEEIRQQEVEKLLRKKFPEREIIEIRKVS